MQGHRGGDSLSLSYPEPGQGPAPSSPLSPTSQSCPSFRVSSAPAVCLATAQRLWDFQTSVTCVSSLLLLKSSWFITCGLEISTQHCADVICSQICGGTG